MSSFANFLQLMAKKRKQDLEVALADERMRRKDMAAPREGIGNLFGSIGDDAEQSKRDGIANSL
jgi:hypothetical protein